MAGEIGAGLGGFTQGYVQGKQLAMQKAQQKMQEDDLKLQQLFKMLPLYPEEKRVDLVNQHILPIYEKRFPNVKFEPVGKWNTIYDEAVKAINNAFEQERSGKIGPEARDDIINRWVRKSALTGKAISEAGVKAIKQEQAGRKTVSRKEQFEKEILPDLPKEVRKAASAEEAGFGATTVKGLLPEEKEKTPTTKGGFIAKKYLSGGFGDVNDPKTLDKVIASFNVEKGSNDATYLTSYINALTKAATLTTPSEMEQMMSAVTGKPVKSPYSQEEYDVIYGLRMKEAEMALGKMSAELQKEIKGNNSKQLDEATAQEYWKKAGGDKVKARQLAKDDGYEF